jgi:hypothetical protein
MLMITHYNQPDQLRLNMMEIFFGIITRQAIRRGSFDSVRELVDAIRGFIDACWNERCEPFIWTKDAATVLAKAQRKPTSDTRH